MTDEQKKRLEDAGWKFGSAEEFLCIEAQSSAEVELALEEEIRRHRLNRELVRE